MKKPCLQTILNLKALFFLLMVGCLDAGGQTNQSLVGDASGALTIRNLKGVKNIELKNAYAMKRDIGGPDEFFIDLLFTDRPVSTGVLERKRYVQIMAAEKRLNGLAVILDKNQKLLSAYLYFDGYSCVYDANADKESNVKFGKQVFEGQVIETQQLIRGAVSSVQPTKVCTGIDGFTWQYRVSFTAKLEPLPKQPKPSDRAVEITKAYAAFHKAVEAEDFEAVKQMLAADVVSSFAGADAKARVTLLRKLLSPYRFVHNVQVYDGGKVADFEIFKRPVRNNQLMPIPESFYWYGLLDAPDTDALPPPPQAKDNTSPQSPPPPPPPPAAAIVRLEPRDFTIRVVFEAGLWKVYWLVSTVEFGDFDGNVLLHLETYKKR